MSYEFFIHPAGQQKVLDFLLTQLSFAKKLLRTPQSFLKVPTASLKQFNSCQTSNSQKLSEAPEWCS